MSEYIIPAGYGEAEYVDKKSRFIGQVQYARTEAEAMAFVESVRKKYADATHNVWAYVLNSGAMRWSDDGEPGGTSGQPTLNVFRSAGVVDVCCVVTRYFGGILLGSGGLVRAYSKAASMALEAAGRARMAEWSLVETVCARTRPSSSATGSLTSPPAAPGGAYPAAFSGRRKFFRKNRGFLRRAQYKDSVSENRCEGGQAHELPKREQRTG